MSNIASTLRQKVIRRVEYTRLYWPRLINAVRHDVHQRYAGSYFGTFWAVLYPLSLLIFYATVYVVIFKVSVPNMEASSYTILVMSGLSAIIMFSESLSSGMSIISGQRSLLMNTVFPAELLPPRSVLASQVPALSALVLTWAGASFVGSVSWIALIMVPFTWILLIMFLMGLVWITSLLALVVRDLQQAVGIINMAAMVLSPMAYTPEMVPQGLKFLVYCNPLSYFIFCLQAPLALGAWPPLYAIVGCVLIGTITFAIGLAFFKRARFAFVDFA